MTAQLVAHRQCYVEPVAKLEVLNVSAGYRDRLVLRDVNLEYGAGIHVLLG